MSTHAGFATFEELVIGMHDKPGLVVIDTFREAYRSIKDFNNAGQVGPALSPLRNWAHKHCAVILVVHSNKNYQATGVARVSGSNALVSSSDAYIILDEQLQLENNDLRWKLDVGGRGIKQATYVVQMDTNTLRFRVLDKDEARKATAQSSSEDRAETHRKVACAVWKVGEITVPQLAQQIGQTKDSIAKVVAEMERVDLIVKTGRRDLTMTGPGFRPFTYELSSRGKELISAELRQGVGASTINSYGELEQSQPADSANDAASASYDDEQVM
jgi:DNA-binding MarR family transcriptional regulator